MRLKVNVSGSCNHFLIIVFSRIITEMALFCHSFMNDWGTWPTGINAFPIIISLSPSPSISPTSIVSHRPSAIPLNVYFLERRRYNILQSFPSFYKGTADEASLREKAYHQAYRLHYSNRNNSLHTSAPPSLATHSPPMFFIK